MTLFLEKMKEVFKTLFPVVVLVLILSTTIVSVPTDITIRFLVGSFLLLLGLTIFLWGVELAMNPIGDYMSREVGASKSLMKIIFLSFLLGFLITVAEPDLLILGNQIQDASNNTMSSFSIVYMVSLGVGIMISLGVLRLLKGMKMNIFMGLVYALILVLGFFVSEEFLAISFDASGATTGALTTPFVLSLSYGLSTFKGGKDSEENAFGLVGIMSSGPILAVMLMSILSGQKNIQGVAEEYVFLTGIISPIFITLPHVIKESVMALVPISALFLGYNFIKFKISKEELLNIFIGLGLTLLGLVLFLTAVNSGFMDMGRMLGMKIAALDTRLLVFVGFILGLIIVLVEPAVHVLGEQIENVSGGSIPINIIRMTLSLGVGIAIALSMLRIVVPSVKLWYFLLPGFAIAILVSFFSDSIFVGIAYDAGGVASGPMTATFVLAFAQGAASSIETANVLVDGFGVIALVAMAPVVSLMLLGLVFKSKEVVYSEDAPVLVEQDAEDFHPESFNHLLLAVVNRGYADKVMELVKEKGCNNVTTYHGRGYFDDHITQLSLVHMEIHEEQEMVSILVPTSMTTDIANLLTSDENLVEHGDITLYVTHTTSSLKNI